MMFFYLPWIIASGWMSSQSPRMAAVTARPPVTSKTDDLV